MKGINKMRRKYENKEPPHSAYKDRLGDQHGGPPPFPPPLDENGRPIAPPEENGGSEFPPKSDGKPANGGKLPPLPPNPAPLMLTNEIAKIFENIVRNDELKLTNSARLLMTILSHREGATQLELAHLAHIKAPTVSVTLHKMEEEGYVARISDENDLRQTRVYLTDKGRDFDVAVRERIFRLDDAALIGFSDEEKAQLVAYLKRIVTNMIDYGGQTATDEQKDI